jgi:hypothetical protein
MLESRFTFHHRDEASGGGVECNILYLYVLPSYLRKRYSSLSKVLVSTDLSGWTSRGADIPSVFLHLLHKLASGDARLHFNLAVFQVDIQYLIHAG